MAQPRSIAGVPVLSRSCPVLPGTGSEIVRAKVEAEFMRRADPDCIALVSTGVARVEDGKVLRLRVDGDGREYWIIDPELTLGWRAGQGLDDAPAIIAGVRVLLADHGLRYLRMPRAMVDRFEGQMRSWAGVRIPDDDRADMAAAREALGLTDTARRWSDADERSFLRMEGWIGALPADQRRAVLAIGVRGMSLRKAAAAFDLGGKTWAARLFDRGCDALELAIRDYAEKNLK